jgi:Mg2+ and Co2+ transporter CorA
MRTQEVFPPFRPERNAVMQRRRFEQTGPLDQISELEKKLHTKRIQVGQQHDVIRELQGAGISTNSAEMLLDRMIDRIDKLCAELERLKKNRPSRTKTDPLPGSSPDGCGSSS